MDYLLTSESVTEGHPDKICDQISDAILDALLEQDKNSKVAVETLATTGLIHVAGEIRTEGYVEIPEIVRGVIRDIGYTSSEMGFDANSCGVTDCGRDGARGFEQPFFGPSDKGPAKRSDIDRFGGLQWVHYRVGFSRSYRPS